MGFGFYNFCLTGFGLTILFSTLLQLSIRNYLLLYLICNTEDHSRSVFVTD